MKEHTSGPPHEEKKKISGAQGTPQGRLDGIQYGIG